MGIHDSWARYYDKAYDLQVGFGEMYTKLTNNALEAIISRVKKGGKILDMGAGTGRLSIPLAEKGYQVTAVEISKEMCAVLKEKAKKAGVKIQIVNKDMTADLKFEVEDGTYDFVVCVFTVLNYLTEPKQMQGFIHNAGHALRLGGKAMISFVEKMKPMQDFYNGRIKEGRDVDDCIKRNILIQAQEPPNLFIYAEQTDGVIDGKKISYRDSFPLREWNRKEVVEGLDISKEFSGTGETYFLIERK